MTALLSAGICKLIHKVTRKTELIYLGSLKAGTLSFSMPPKNHHGIQKTFFSVPQNTLFAFSFYSLVNNLSLETDQLFVTSNELLG